jgi:hypothetical protein
MNLILNKTRTDPFMYIMNKICYVCLIIIISLLCFICKGQDLKGNTITYVDSVSRQNPTESEVRRVVIIGATKEQVVQAFGTPFEENITSNGMDIAVYVFRFRMDDLTAGWTSRFSGFEVYYTNDIVIGWDPAYSELNLPTWITSSNSTQPRTSGLHNKASSEISFYLVSDLKLTNGMYVDTPRLPKLGYIPNHANFTVRHLQSIDEGIVSSSIDGKEIDNHIISISLTKKDAQLFEDLTSKNIGDRILIMVDNKPIIAPRIYSPINNGKFDIIHLDENELQELKGKLETLVELPK